ncbi:MAG: peptidylprolyl isomerase, partial [Alphaproteobacteria bacterium]|nr:peptidylprolyl isomerase [Alphaproteobacteria bacterium]
MKMLKKLFFSLLVSSFFVTGANAMDKENTLYLDLDYGRVVIEMLPEKAPGHVARIKELAREGFYDG